MGGIIERTESRTTGFRWSCGETRSGLYGMAGHQGSSRLLEDQPPHTRTMGTRKESAWTQAVEYPAVCGDSCKANWMRRSHPQPITRRDARKETVMVHLIGVAHEAQASGNGKPEHDVQELYSLFLARNNFLEPICSRLLHARLGEQLGLSPRSSGRVGGLSAGAQRTRRSSKGARLSGRGNRKRSSAGDCRCGSGAARVAGSLPCPQVYAVRLRVRAVDFKRHHYLGGSSLLVRAIQLAGRNLGPSRRF